MKHFQISKKLRRIDLTDQPDPPILQPITSMPQNQHKTMQTHVRLFVSNQNLS